MGGVVLLILVSLFDLCDGSQLHQRELKLDIPTAKLTAAKDIAQK